VSLNEFRHALYYLQESHSRYADKLNYNYFKSRKLARKYEILLGNQFDTALHNMTESGLSILNASFSLPKEIFDVLEVQFPEQERPYPRTLVDEKFPVNDGQNFISTISLNLQQETVRRFINHCGVSKEFKENAYKEANFLVV
jgi:hypothetical protein